MGTSKKVPDTKTAMRRYLPQLLLSNSKSVIDGLKRLYVSKLLPLESTYLFHDFVSPAMTEMEFDAKPMIMLLGQYSTGKTTFIKHLLKCEYPGAYIGPEPTTDRFVTVMEGGEERIIPGNAAVVQADMPFSGLSKFGTSFLSKFECSQMPNPILQEFTFIDTPGVLSGEKQRTERTYDFPGVTEWFASKCDMILLLFDPHKLDISDEFKEVIDSLHGHDDKLRFILNKADQVSPQQLMRVYGALMWSLGRVVNVPEVMRVYIGSFTDEPVNDHIAGPFGKELFDKEKEDLLMDIRNIPRKALDRRVNEFVKRARAAKVHAYLIGHLKSQMPYLFQKESTQERLLFDLETEFMKVQLKYHIPSSDLPNIDRFRSMLSNFDISKFARLKQWMIQDVDDMLAYDIPRLLQHFGNTSKL